MFPLRARDKITCPVCGYETGERICPYSQGDKSFNGRGNREHKTYNNRFSTEASNPYWDINLQGFRLGWAYDDIEVIFNDACSLVRSSSRFSRRPVSTQDSNSKVHISESATFGMTEPEIFALCLLGAYRSVEFPKSVSSIELAYKMFQAYKIPAGVQDGVINTFGALRNLYSLTIRERGPKYKKFRVGLRRLFDKWMLGTGHDEFLTYKDHDADHTVMARALSIKPRVTDLGTLSDMPDLAKHSDKQRYDIYTKLRDRHGFDKLFSQLYYHTPAGQRQTDDIAWCMDTFDSVDVFGFPGFVFLPDNRLERLFFVMGLACIRTTHDEASGYKFVNDHHYLASTISPYVKVTPDIWKDVSLHIRNDLMSNSDIQATYVGAVHRLAVWSIDENKLAELYRRVCGYAGPPDMSSTIDGRPITPDDVKSLQAGNTKDGSTVDMLNFKKALSIIAPFINDPSPLPFQARPRYGMLYCKQCGKISKIPVKDDSPFVQGCFDHIDAVTRMPVAYNDRGTNKNYHVVLQYECPACKKPGCRELDVALNHKCDRCKGHSEITSYRFDDSLLRYGLHCQSCGHDERAGENYDTVEFDYDTITATRKHGDHGEPLFMLTYSHNSEILRMVEHPYNLLPTLEPVPDDEGKVPCPYELEENKTGTGRSLCCQNMPDAWPTSSSSSSSSSKYDDDDNNVKPDGRPRQSRLVREGGSHTTRLVEELSYDDGTVKKRYECLDHREIVLGMVNNLGMDPEHNPGKLKRGTATVSKIYLLNELVKINSKKALLDMNRVKSTRELMEIPLSVTAVPAIATDQGLVDSTRYPRTVNMPDKPVHEVVKLNPATSKDYDQCISKTNNKLAVELRHFYSFDITEPAEPEPVIPCEELCDDWSDLDLIRSTMPLERMKRVYKMQKTEKRIRAWQLSHSPSLLIPGKSMPFIPTVTPKERVKVAYTRERELVYTGMVAVHVDRSGSMQSAAEGSMGSAKLICDYLVTADECNRCGSGYRWNDDLGCYKVLSRTDVARRLLASVINEAKERNDQVTIYSYERTAYNVSPPTRDYAELMNLALYSNLLRPSGGTELSTSLDMMLRNLDEWNIPDMLVTIILSDGAIGIGSLGPSMVRILKELGPVYIYQVADFETMSMSSLESTLKQHGWDPGTDHSITWQKADLSDGGKELFKKASKDTNRHLKQ